MIALPKILRLRDESYLEKLQQLLQENLEFIQGFQAASMEHIELLKQWNFTGKEIYGDHSLYLWNRSPLHTIEPDWQGFLERILRRLLSAVRIKRSGAEGPSGSVISCRKSDLRQNSHDGHRQLCAKDYRFAPILMQG